MLNCIHQHCLRCNGVFCGGCLRTGCHDSHSARGPNAIHDRVARVREQRKVVHAQLLAVFQTLAPTHHAPALAALATHLSKAEHQAISAAVRAL
jgi:hypothetical protein